MPVSSATPSTSTWEQPPSEPALAPGAGQLRQKNKYLKIKSGKHFEGNKNISQVSQYSCSYSNLAPTGCTQYFYDATGTGTVQTYNYNGGIHLANQEQTICIREERAFCRYGMRGKTIFVESLNISPPQVVHLCR